MRKTTVLLSVLVLFLNAGIAQGWTIDKAHSQLNFGITHMGINEIDGRFSITDAKLNASKDDLSDATITLVADIKTVNTGSEGRDNVLKGAEFFDADKNPTLNFSSTAFKKLDGKNYQLSGDLTLHGITKPVVLNVILNGTTTNQRGKKVAGFKVTGIIKRSDFSIAPALPAVAVSDEVALNANVEFAKD